MSNMYNLNMKDATIEIDGFPFFPENFTSNESFPRRELNKTSIKSGTEFNERGKYIPRSFTFTTTVDVPEGKPDIHDKIFQELVSKPCEIVSIYMGIFKGDVIIKKTPERANPSQLALEIQVVEIPGVNSLIPNEFVK